jgi:hypothetical protein
MDPELLEAIREYVTANPKMKMLAPDEAQSLYFTIAGRFALQTDRVWWWDSLPSEAVSVLYDPAEGFDPLLKMLPVTTEACWLFVTDDHPPPWSCICGTRETIVAMLKEHRFLSTSLWMPDLAVSFLILTTTRWCFSNLVTRKYARNE